MHNSGIICENLDIQSDLSTPLRPESLLLPNISHNDEQEQSKSNCHKQILQKSYLKEDNFYGISQNQPLLILEQKSINEDMQCSHLSSSLPQGTITRKGDMIQFVADNLQEKIKQSSPMSYADNDSSSSRRSSVHSFSSSTSFATSSGMSRSPSSQFRQSPDDIPPIDATAVIELENHAHKVADNLDLMMGNIRNNLHKMSAITIGCQDAYKRSVDITCDSVDASIKSMYALMAKCEELTAVMGPVEQLALQIKEIKRILDLFEAQLSEK
ncbi:BLOC-1- complex subunit 6 [Bulinus truncatus]|nr:BLOC-1- complex subunit 6 [Bulinus truncatus]